MTTRAKGQLRLAAACFRRAEEAETLCAYVSALTMGLAAMLADEPRRVLPMERMWS